MKALKDIKPELRQLFKTCEDLPLESTFLSIKEIFGEQILLPKVGGGGGVVGGYTVKLAEVAFLPPLNELKKLTLVLDLDETLIHFVETKHGGG